MTQVEYVTSPAVFYDLLTSSKIEVQSVSFVSNEMVEVRWKYRDDFIEPSVKTNVVLAAYTTTQARLKLYSYLEQLGDRAQYADTDSIIFASSPNDTYMPALGDYLGDLTNEVKGGQIIEFVTGGPKNYAYKLRNNDGSVSTVCKVRGITLNYKNALHINFDSLKHVVTENREESVAVKGTQIARKAQKLVTTNQTKQYRFIFDKRIIVDDYNTIPYGFQKHDNNIDFVQLSD